MPVICDLYCRVSSLEQAQEGYSLGEQEARLRQYASAQGWKIHAVHIDPGFSGAKLERPGIQAVIADAKAKRINMVVTYKLDRLSRSQKDTLYLLEDVFKPNGVGYASMTEGLDSSTPFGQAMIGLLAVFAQLEREQISERMMLGRIASAKEGNWRGGSGVPIGYRYIPKTTTEDGRLVIDEYEAGIVREVFDLFLQGLTFNAIHERCAAKYSTSYGRFGSGGAAIIPSMLSNRAYIGEIKYCGVWYPGKHQPIMDAETFARAQTALVEYRATLDEHRRRPYHSTHLLTGLLYCGECGAKWCYHSCSYTKKSGEKVTYGTYCCYTKNASKTQRRADRCSLSVQSAPELEALVLDEIRKLSFDDFDDRTEEEPVEIGILEDQLKSIERKMEKAVDLYMQEGIGLDIVNRKMDELKADYERTTSLLDAAKSRQSRRSKQEFMTAMECRDAILDGPPEGARDLVLALIRKITIYADELVIDWNI